MIKRYSTGPDPKTAKVKKGSGAKITRNKKGDLVATKDKDFYYQREDILAANKARSEGRTDTPVKIKKSEGHVRGGTKKMVAKARRRARKSAASPQAKRSAIRLYKHG